MCRRQSAWARSAPARRPAEECVSIDGPEAACTFGLQILVQLLSNHHLPKSGMIANFIVAK